MKNFLRTIFLLFLTFSTLEVNAITIVNAGVSFSGDASGDGQNSIAKRFPYTSKLYEEKDAQNPNLSKLNKILVDKLKKDYKGMYKMEFDNLMRTKDDVLSLAFVLNFEEVFESKSEMHNVYRIEVLVGVDAIFFDFKTKKIVASYPIMLSVSDLLETKPSEANIYKMFAKMFGDSPYYLNKVNGNIFDFFIGKLNIINLASANNISIGVKNVVLEAEAKSNILKLNLGDEEGSKKILANMFNSKISSKFNIPLMPYTNGAPVFVNMANSYMESSDLMQIVLEVPDPTYEISLIFEKLMSKKTKEKQGMGIYFFGAFGYVGMNIKGSSKQAINRFKNGFSKTYVLGQEHNWSFNADYMTALLMFFDVIPNDILKKSENKELLTILNKCK